MILDVGASNENNAEQIAQLAEIGECVYRNVYKKEDVNVYLSNNQILFKVSNLSFMSRLVEGSYPDTSSLIPNDFLLSIKLNREELISVVNRASLFIDSENISFVKFSLTKNSNNIEYRQASKVNLDSFKEEQDERI